MRKKHRLCLLALCGLLFLSGCGAKAPAAASPGRFFSSSGSLTDVFSGEPSSAPDASSCAQNPSDALRQAAVFLLGENRVWIKGREYTLETAPFLEEGVLYLPAAPITALLGGSFASSDGVYYLNYRGNVSVMMEEYNVLLFNSDSVIMDRTPVLKDGTLCLPVESLARVLCMSCYKSPSRQIYVLGASEALSEAELAAIRADLGAPALERVRNEALLSLSKKQGADYGEVERSALFRKLWCSDSEGNAFSLWLDDSGALHREAYFMSQKLPKNGLFTVEAGKSGPKLYDITSKKEICEPPDELYKAELRQATGRYMELLAARFILKDEKAEALLPVYRAAISGDFEAPGYRSDLTAPYESGLFRGRKPEEAWHSLFEKAQVGDFLVFSAEGAAAEYGYFNHSALILEKDSQKGVLRLLQARGSEYGVGADLEMDYLSYSSLEEVEYYRNYGTCLLCGAGELSEAERRKMTQDAYEKYNGYQFGYGGRMGLQETNCTELIDEAYLSAGIDLINGDYESRLKEVLKGNTKNLVLIPDDLLFSERVRVIAVWRR